MNNPTSAGAGGVVHRTTPLAPLPGPGDPPLVPEWVAYILRATHLLPYYRHVALTLATHADLVTGAIPPGAPTGEAELMAQTGLPDYRVRGGLRSLESRCLIHRHGDQVTGLVLSLTSQALIRKARAAKEASAR
ncbi:hypothetical protein ACFXKG_18315 [Streptomyces sp. NPDC059255]|uniref:hypothetical protein n=1 Tax=Streptomyces sp. NPDC059255 TaxID=3346793 RepID=UPI0036A588A5